MSSFEKGCHILSYTLHPVIQGPNILAYISQ